MTLQPRPTAGDTSWFTHDRFGLFVHWGLYALPARHEWVQSFEKMDAQTYNRYFRHFDPDLYDPHAWAAAAADAGMKYFVVTTKHHEGFCLWDTKYTDFKAPNTPAGRDLLTPMVEAFREQGLRVGFYHSLLDWHHPDYTTDERHPMRDNAAFTAEDSRRDLQNYTQYLHNQTEELLTQFGPIDILWYDFSVAASDRYPGKGRDEWQSKKLLELVRSLQPQVIVNDRLQIPQDVRTPEQYQPRGWVKINGEPVVWEACQTFSGSWGYHRDEDSWKSLDMLVKMLIDTVSKGGNLLLNVGPTGRGEFDERALERLKGIGVWMKRHSRSIYGCTQAPGDVRAPQDCRYTYNPQTQRLYLHLFSWPFGAIHLDGMAERVEYAQLLNDASEIPIVRQEVEYQGDHGFMSEARSEDLLVLKLPTRPPDPTVPVIELFLKEGSF